MNHCEPFHLMFFKEIVVAQHLAKNKSVFLIPMALHAHLLKEIVDVIMVMVATYALLFALERATLLPTIALLFALERTTLIPTIATTYNGFQQCFDGGKTNYS